MTQFIHRSNVKKFLLDFAKTRPGLRMERVSAEVFEWLEDEMGLKLRNFVRSLPSKGRTIYPPVRRAKAKENNEL